MHLADDVLMSTVDGTEDKEYPFIILDLVSCGDLLYSSAFVTDIQRMCVGSSRVNYTSFIH